RQVELAKSVNRKDAQLRGRARKCLLCRSILWKERYSARKIGRHNCGEEITLSKMMRSSINAWSVRWDLKGQTLRLVLPRVRASE
ncbi:hypothetical protein A2U01_0079701, partial [Trifolium medium]|nr:hypothetical protein [Trifolium medium]